MVEDDNIRNDNIPKPAQGRRPAGAGGGETPRRRPAGATNADGTRRNGEAPRRHPAGAGDGEAPRRRPAGAVGGEVPRRRPVAEGTGEAPRRRPVAVESNDTNAYRRYREDYPERAYGKRKRGSFSKGVLVLLIGIAAGVLIGINLNLLHSKPDAIEAFDRKLDLGVSEVTNLSYETYWNFVYSSYIVLGDDRETAQLYKISDKVPRHNLDMENFVTGDDGYLHYSSEDISDTKIGIDVSSYQGDIDWDVLSKEDHVQFAFIKATEGSTYQDDLFTQNWEAAEAAGVFVGAYHFFRFESDGKEQADNFIATVPKLENTLPPVIDIEIYDGETVPDAKAARTEIQEMADALEAYYGVKPILYTNPSTYMDYLMGHRWGYAVWMSNPYCEPIIDWTFWQYSFEGDLQGFSQEHIPVDLNVYNGSRKQFLKQFSLQEISN